MGSPSGGRTRGKTERGEAKYWFTGEKGGGEQRKKGRELNTTKKKNNGRGALSVLSRPEGSKQ